MEKPADPPPPDLPPASTPAPARTPWPMTWVVFAILGFVAVHTLVNLGFRKPGAAHEPAAKAREQRRTFVQASMKGWTRFAAELTPVAAAHPTPAGGSVAFTRTATPAELHTAVPFELVGLPARDPRLHPAPTALATPHALPADGVWRVRLEFDPPLKSAGFGEVLAYAKDHRLHIFLQDDSRTIPEESPVPLAPVLKLTLPSRVLPPGDWQATLYTKETIFGWTFTVAPELAPPPEPAATPPTP